MRKWHALNYDFKTSLHCRQRAQQNKSRSYYTSCQEGVAKVGKRWRLDLGCGGMQRLRTGVCFRDKVNRMANDQIDTYRCRQIQIYTNSYKYICKRIFLRPGNICTNGITVTTSHSQNQGKRSEAQNLPAYQNTQLSR